MYYGASVCHFAPAPFVPFFCSCTNPKSVNTLQSKNKKIQYPAFLQGICLISWVSQPFLHMFYYPVISPSISSSSKSFSSQTGVSTHAHLILFQLSTLFLLQYYSDIPFSRSQLANLPLFPYPITSSSTFVSQKTTEPLIPSLTLPNLSIFPHLSIVFGPLLKLVPLSCFIDVFCILSPC